MEKVIPQQLNYADLKPEAIDNMVKLVRFTPTATPNNLQPNDTIKFMVTNQGFLDPYSTYFKFSVKVNLPNSVFAASIVDRSAHSFISRLLIRSQGTELERIEQYDVLAGMINDMLYSTEQCQSHSHEGFPVNQTPIYSGPGAAAAATKGDLSVKNNMPIGEPMFYRKTDVATFNQAEALSALGIQSMCSDNGGAIVDYDKGEAVNQLEMTFCIPIYSGIIGVLMQDKKLLPLSLMPLEIEIVLNPYVMRAVGHSSRAYEVSDFEMYGHMLFFEQEVHRSLEAVVAENGIFIHFNSFYLAPVTQTSQSTTVGQYAQINVHHKSINSVHFCFLYSGYESAPTRRKLSFVSHGLTQLQIRNGTDLYPSEYIRGDSKVVQGKNTYHQFFVETLKGWGKMHDPTTDTCLNAASYTQDVPLHGAVPADAAALTALYPSSADVTDAAGYVAAMKLLVEEQRSVGRCQYAISFEGESLGADKTTMAGRKAQLPFDINYSGTKLIPQPSYMFIFVKSDFVLFVRPDLVVTVLGR